MGSNFFKLLDKAHENMVLRITEGICEIHKPSGWVRTSLLIDYMFPSDDSLLYGMYEEITEEEAMKAIATL